MSKTLAFERDALSFVRKSSALNSIALSAGKYGSNAGGPDSSQRRIRFFPHDEHSHPYAVDTAVGDETPLSMISSYNKQGI